ncbi:MAG: gamma-glutamylcyclotransferase [Rhodobacterales bacterium 32-66-7]|nr:MAG: gamma-glutamylcyclotransferase [Rhodobacterales bacterium 32-66-7]
MPTSPALWVFGYGSLIWDPGFPVAERRIARAVGWQRSFCMRSIHHRGTPEAPGLVLALDRADDASCTGVALRVKAGAEAATLAALRERELVSSAYLETHLPVMTDFGAVKALTYVIDPDHVQYCGSLPLDDQARIIAHAIGKRGANRDYLTATVAHLAKLGISDPTLEWLDAEVQKIV